MSQNEPRVTWGEDGWASANGWVAAHCTNTEDEYIGPQDVWVSIGTGLPVGAYLQSPPAEEEGKTIVRTADGWELLPDFRGETAYNKQNGSPTIISKLGDLSVNLTWLAPQSQFDVWDEPVGIWVKDEATEQQFLTNQAQAEKTARLTEATSLIAPLQDAVDFGIATPVENAALLDFKHYRVVLTRVDVTLHPVSWPPKP